MNQQLMVRLVPRHTLQMRFFLILAQPLQARQMAHFQIYRLIKIVFPVEE